MTTPDDLPVCVYCCRGTTPQRLVLSYVKLLGPSARRIYYAHDACVARYRGKTIPPDLWINRTRSIPSLAERLGEWNDLADELDRLLARCWSEPRALSTANIACRAWNAVGFRKTDMTWALADPRPNRPDEAGDQVRILRWHVERLRAALERDARLSRSPRSASRGLPALDIRLSETVAAVRETYSRERTPRFGAAAC
jgi:hypothetical protein